MQDKNNFVRVAGLRLMLVESDVIEAIDFIASGRVDTARHILDRILDHIRNTQKDIRAAQNG